MTRDEVLDKAKAAGLVVQPCADPSYIGIRAYKPETQEVVRVGSSGEVYIRGDDGWMYQVGTIEDVARYVESLS